MKKKILFVFLLMINFSLFAQKVGDYSFVYPENIDMMLGIFVGSRGLPAYGTGFDILSSEDYLNNGVKITECYKSGNKIYMTFLSESEPAIFEFVYKDTGEGDKTASLIKLSIYSAKKVKGVYQKIVCAGTFSEPAGDLFSNAYGFGKFYGGVNEIYGLVYDWSWRNFRYVMSSVGDWYGSKISSNLKKFSAKHKSAMLGEMKKKVEDSLVSFAVSEGNLDKEKFFALKKYGAEKVYDDYKNKFESANKDDIDAYERSMTRGDWSSSNFWNDEYNYNEIISGITNEVYEKHKVGVESQIEMRNKSYVKTFELKAGECICSIVPEYDSIQNGFDSESFYSKANEKIKAEYNALEKEYDSKAYMKAIKFKSFDEICGDINLSKSLESVNKTFATRERSYNSFMLRLKDVLIRQSVVHCKTTKNPTVDSVKESLKTVESSELEKAKTLFESGNEWSVHFKNFESIYDKFFDDEILGKYCVENKKGILVLTKDGTNEFKKKDIPVPDYNVIAEIAEAWNKQCPKRLDKNTILNNSVANKDTLVINYVVNDVTKSQLKSVLPKLKSGTIASVKENGLQKIYLDSGIRAEYNYYDDNGELLGNFTIENKEWKK